MDEYTITGMHATDGGARLTLYITGSDEAGAPAYETLTVLSARLSALPTIGPASADTVAFLRQEHEVCLGVGQGLRVLSAGDTSRGMLLRKLRMRGIPAAAAREALEELSSRGYLDEKRAARREAERGVDKLWGDRRILSDLSAKGFGREALADVAAFLEEEDGAMRCAALLRKKRVALSADPHAQQKLFASLARYGYSAGEIKAALVEVYGQ